MSSILTKNQKLLIVTFHSVRIASINLNFELSTDDSMSLSVLRIVFFHS